MEPRGPEPRGGITTLSPSAAGARKNTAAVRRVRTRLAVLCGLGLLLIGGAYAFRRNFLEWNEASGPAGPAVDRAAFSAVWTDRRVLLLGVGDSMTAGYGASKGLSYFDRLVRNPPDEFEEMRSICLGAVLPKLEVRNIAVSGSTSLEHIETLRRLEAQPSEVFGLVVMTTGGNDIIHDYGQSPPREGAMYGATVAQAVPWTANFQARLSEMLDLLAERFPGGHRVFLADIYDPTDGVGSASSVGLPAWPDGLAILSAYNDVIHRTCRERPEVSLVPVHREFLGHGIYCNQPWREHYRRGNHSHWYYVNFEDPNDLGYDALRRLFLNEIAAARGQLR